MDEGLSTQGGPQDDESAGGEKASREGDGASPGKDPLLAVCGNSKECIEQIRQFCGGEPDCMNKIARVASEVGARHSNLLGIRILKDWRVVRCPGRC